MFIYDDFCIGGGFSYRLGIKEEFSSPGLNMEFHYYVIDYFRTGIDLTYYVANINFSPAAFETNVSGSFLYALDREWTLYGLTGFQFIWAQYDWDEPFGKESHIGLGFNLGGGIEYYPGYVSIFTQPKITLYCIDRFRITPNFTIGVRYFF